MIASTHLVFPGKSIERTVGPLFYNGVWRSWLARTAGGREVAGSSPVTPTILIKNLGIVVEYNR